MIILAKSPDVDYLKILLRIREEVQTIGDEAEEIGIKFLLSGYLSFYQQDYHCAYPDRILGSKFLLGNPNLLYQARLKVFQEMTRDEEIGESVMEQMKEIR